MTPTKAVVLPRTWPGSSREDKFEPRRPVVASTPDAPSVQDQIDKWLVAGAVRAQYPAQLRSLTANHRQPFPLRSRRPPSQSLTVLIFQAGHASFTLVVGLSRRQTAPGFSQRCR
jgi:hypothetical protein